MSADNLLPTKLNGGHKNLLRLMRRDAKEDGWAPVSRVVYPMVAGIPAGLCELEQVGDAGAGRARLTALGTQILDAMEWL